MVELDQNPETRFTLHPSLAEETVQISEWMLNRVYLMNERRYLWIVLVPALPGLKELHNVPPLKQGYLVAEIARTTERLQSEFNISHFNVGMLGNIVPQLHIHVVARREGDPAWPGPVWGHSPRQPYAEEKLKSVCDRLKSVLR